MTLDAAIKHCEDVAEDRCGCAEDCVNEHRQLAEWLKELKAYRVADTPQTDCTVITDASYQVLDGWQTREKPKTTDCPWK